MDATTRMHGSQNWKFCKVQEREDRISSLPDSILHHILSLLPTKYAIGTSILSKRWEYLWASVPILDFDDCLVDFYERRFSVVSFMNFVDRALLLHDLPTLKKFSLSCNGILGSYDSTHLNTWISAAIKRNVQHLNLSICAIQSFALPRCLFTCRSLQILELKLHYTIKFPSFICFSSLKVLHLSFITFLDQYLTQQLFSNCPILEELIVKKCIWVNMKIVSISAPALKRLTIYSSVYEHYGISDCEIKIYAPSLVSLNYKGYLAKDYYICNLTSLIDSSINITTDEYYLDERHEEIGFRASKLLRGVSYVKSLSISCYTTHTLAHSEDVSTHLPTFNNLIHLELPMKSFERFASIALVALLKSSPNLESLVFPQGLQLDQHYNDDAWMTKLVSPSFLSHLKVAKLCNFHGNEDELYLVGFLLKNARILEKMTLVSSEALSVQLRKQVEVTKKLLLLPKATMSSVISFS